MRFLTLELPMKPFDVVMSGVAKAPDLVAQILSQSPAWLWAALGGFAGLRLARAMMHRGSWGRARTR